MDGIEIRRCGAQKEAPFGWQAKSEIRAVISMTGQDRGGVRHLVYFGSVVLAVILFTTPCAVAASTGGDLLPQCHAAVTAVNDDSVVGMTEHQRQGVYYCMGLVHGIGDVLQTLGTINLSDEWKLGMGVRVVAKYLEDHPEELAERDSVVVIEALEAAYPAEAHTSLPKQEHDKH